MDSYRDQAQAELDAACLEADPPPDHAAAAQVYATLALVDAIQDLGTELTDALLSAADGRGGAVQLPLPIRVRDWIGDWLSDPWWKTRREARAAAQRAFAAEHFPPPERVKRDLRSGS